VSVLRVAYVKVAPDTQGFDADLKSRLRRIDASKDGHRVGVSFGTGMSKGFSSTSGTFARVAATAAAKAALVGAGAAAATPGLIQLTAALAPATGALVALPAVLGAVKIASATFKVATADVGSAITAGMTGTAEQAKKSLEKLPPAARSFASAIVALKPKVDALRQSVAQRFFLPLQNDIKPLVNLYFPMLRKQMADLAGPLGGLGEELAQSARSAEAFRAVRGLFVNTRLSVLNLRDAVFPLVAAFADLVSSTSGFLPGLAAGFSSAAQRAAVFVGELAASGRIAEVFRNSVITLKDLGGIVGNVGSILRSVFSAATAGGNSLLSSLRALTGQAAAFLKSGSGSGALASTFQSLAALGQALRTSLGAVLPAIAQSVQKLAPAIVAVAGPLAQMVVALAPLIPLAAGLAAQLLTRLTPAIAALAGWLTENTGVVKAALPVILAYIAAMKVFAIVTAVQAVGGIVKFIAATNLAKVATAAWTAVQWVLNAALTANPIGIVVVALGALVAGVILAYRHSETFRTVVQRAWQGIQVAVSFAWNNVIKPTVTALVGFFRDVIAPTAMFLWSNVFKPAFAGIGFVVKAAWVVIQIALKAFQLYLTNVIFPVVRFLYNSVIKPIFALAGAAISLWWNGYAKPVFNLAKAGFSALGAGLSAVWNRVIKPVFSALGGFLIGTVAPAFTKGVAAIKGAWAKVQDAAKVPVSFVVNRVINPLVGGINKVASFVGVKDQIPKITGFASGGQIPGTPSFKDNRLAAGPNGLLKVATGEFVTNTKSTMANLPLIRAINAKRGRVNRDDVDPYLDGFERGGRIGDGIGDFFKKALQGAKGAASAVLNPKEALVKVANAALSQIPGAGSIVGMVKGMGRRVIGGIGSWLSDKLGGGLGGNSVLGGWRGMQRLIAGRFPGLGLISGLRRGARTLSGNLSLHALGRAVDYPAVRALAAWIKSTFGAKTKELITPWQDLNLHNGKPHTYTGAIWNQHNFAGGNAHVHWAAGRGGLVGGRSGLPVGSYDSGGFLPTGLSLAHNGTGRPEPVGHRMAGNTYNIKVEVPVGASPAETGRQVVEVIKAFEFANGKRWRAS
jgi:hypothetical protein